MDYDKEAIADFLEQVEDEGNPRIYANLVEGLAAIPKLPAQWEPLREAGENGRQVVAQLWRNVGANLPQTIWMLERKLAGYAVLITDRTPPSLLYLFDVGRDLMARRGYWPASELPVVAWSLAVDLLPFYQLHDGWVNIFSGDGGPMPSKNWRVIGRAPNVQGFLEIYSKGSQSLGFDLDTDPAKPFSLDAEDDEVDEVRDFWRDLDDRLAAGLNGFPDVS